MTTEQEALSMANHIQTGWHVDETKIAAMIHKLVAEREADRAAMGWALDVMDEAMNYTNSAAHSPSMTRELLAAITDLRQRLEGTT